MDVTLQPPKQLVRNHLGSAAGLLKQVRAARRWQFPQIALSYSTALNDLLMAALITWRQELGDARPLLENFLSTAREAREKFTQSGDIPNRWMGADFASPVLISLLVEGRFDETFRDVLPPREAWVKAPARHFDVVLMTALLDRMREGRVPREGTELLAKIKKPALVRETYRKYFEILDACSRGKSTQSLVAEAEALFLRRRKTRYYAEGLITGGGDVYNDLVVDYVLATVLEWCKSPAATRRKGRA